MGAGLYLKPIDPEDLARLMYQFLGRAPPRMSRWERLLVYFGLRRAPGPYVHTFNPAVLPPPVRYVELEDWTG